MLKLILAGTASLAFGVGIMLLPESQAATATVSAPQTLDVASNIQPCTARGWPYRCEIQNNVDRPARIIRIVTTDHMPAPQAEQVAPTVSPQAAAAPLALPPVLSNVRAADAAPRAPSLAPAASLFDPHPVFNPTQVGALAARAQSPNG